jgi:hypothetical protein
MGSEMQPQIMRAQKSEQILIFEIKKDYWHGFQISNHYFQSFGFIHVHRKFICGSATHFSFYIFIKICIIFILPKHLCSQWKNACQNTHKIVLLQNIENNRKNRQSTFSTSRYSLPGNSNLLIFILLFLC